MLDEHLALPLPRGGAFYSLWDPFAVSGSDIAEHGERDQHRRDQIEQRIVDAIKRMTNLDAMQIT